MEKNHMNNPIIIFAVALLLLLINSYAPEDVTILGYEVKPVDFFGDVRTDDFYDDEYEDNENFDEEYDSTALQNDSAFLNSPPKYYTASVFNFNFITNFIVAELDKLTYSENPASNNRLSGNIEQLNNFFNALKKADKQQVRVAHYGDSTLEGDLISSDLRDLFQKKFGGTGVGIVPITSHDTRFRETTDLSFSDDWETASVYTRNKQRLPVGISGHVFVNGNGSWVEMKTNNRYKTVRKFNTVKLFYSHAKTGAKVKYSINGKPTVTKTLKKGNDLHVLEINCPNSKSVKFIFPGAKSAYYYGVSLESNTGVYIDNFALRGNSGVDLKKISSESLSAFYKKLNYKLVILEFGLNILSGRKTNFSRYERDMVKVIKKMKTAMPNASFILVSVHDKCIKKGSKFITDPAVPKLVQAQKNIAKKTKIAFWNLYEAMGGKNSMVKWVNSNPPKAFKDYTHFNDIGAKQEAKLIFNDLMEKYK
jgi:hypothetical protein